MATHLGGALAAGADEVLAEDHLVAEDAVARVLLGVEELLERLVTMVIRRRHLAHQPADLVPVLLQLLEEKGEDIHTINTPPD